MKSVYAKRQHGAALLAMLMVLALGASWYLVSRLNADSGVAAATRNVRNAEALNRAKQALIGYVAAQAAKAGENNPGAMPCPENPADFDSTTGNDGKVGTSCGVTTVGRFPWRTLGVDQLVDASGEPLWYVVSPGWGVASGSNTSINSNSVGRLTVDGTATTPIASPGKVNYSAHGLAVGDTVSFTTGGTLPTGITAGATYYVIAAGLTVGLFEIAATPGGSAINFTGTSSGPHNVHRNPARTATTPIASPGQVYIGAHGFGVGDVVSFITGGTLPTGIIAGAAYYVIAAGLTADSFEIATTPGGAAINFTGTSSGPHYLHRNPSGAAKSVVALIIAPGPAFIVPAATGCSAWTQVRSSVGTPDWRNYLECENATSPADGIFVTSGPSGSFNDQVMAITQADVMPAIEAAIARRIESEIVPVLTAYANPTWGTFPFPAPFDDPATSDYRGQAGSPYQGLLPFYYHAGSCGGDVRCSTSTTISWNSAPSLSTGSGTGYLPSSPSCYLSGSTPICEGYYYGGSLNISMTDTTTTQIARGLRTFTVANHTGTALAWRWNGSSWVSLSAPSVTLSRSLASSGSARFIAAAPLPSVPDWGYYYIQGSRPAISDHPVLSLTDPTTGWFVRNEWYRLLYYAVAPNHAPGGSLSCNSDGSLPPITCLQVTNLADPTKQRAILALAGRALTSLSQTRPSNALQNYLDSAENQNADTIFVQSAVGRSFNDRFISVSKNP